MKAIRLALLTIVLFSGMAGMFLFLSQSQAQLYSRVDNHDGTWNETVMSDGVWREFRRVTDDGTVIYRAWTDYQHRKHEVEYNPETGEEVSHSITPIQ